GDPRARAPTDPAAEEPFADHNPDDDIIGLLKEGLARSRARLSASSTTEPSGAGIHEQDEPADDDGGRVPEHGAPAGDDLAPPLAHNAPDEGDHVGQVLAQYAPVDAPAVPARAPENEHYLDRSVDPEMLSIALVVFPKLNRVIPQSETMYAGWSAFINGVAPT